MSEADLRRLHVHAVQHHGGDVGSARVMEPGARPAGRDDRRRPDPPAPEFTRASSSPDVIADRIRSGKQSPLPGEGKLTGMDPRSPLFIEA